MTRLILIPIALLLLLAGAMVWSGGGASQQVDFRFINRGDIITLDPNQMSYLQDIRMAYAMWEGLYSYEPITLEPIPGVASSVDISSDSRVYTFHLRPEARWSNGDPVVAHDFIFAWKRMLDEPGDYTYLHYYIKGAEQYVADGAKGLPVDFKTVGVEELDPHTLRVTLNDPVTFFLDLVAFTPFLPLHEKSMQPFKEVSTDGKVTYNQHFTRPPQVVTNGPFVLKKWDFKRRLILEKNPYYWDVASVKSRSLEMVVCDDRLSQLMLFDSGTVDWLAEVSSEVVPELMEKGNKALHNFEGFGTTFLTLMVRPKFKDGSPNPLADKRIRQALSMAIDRDQVVKNITRCGEPPATTYIPPQIFAPLGWRSIPGYGFDPKRARQLLADAGYPDGGRLPGVRYLFRSNSGPLPKELAENYTRQWKQNLNVDMPLMQVESSTAKELLKQKDYAIAGSNWSGDYNDPSTFTDKYLSTSINNDSGWVNPEFDQLLKNATKEADAQKRLRILEKAERLINEELPIIPVFQITNQYMFRANVKGINTNPRHVTMFKSVEVLK
jgi:oligopeptide transport system substrate-binding protein